MRKCYGFTLGDYLMRHGVSQLLKRSGSANCQRQASQLFLESICSQWNFVLVWCSAKNIYPWQAIVQQFAEFLHHLYQQGQLKVCMIEGYESAIGVSLKTRGKSVGKDLYICGLITQFLHR